MNKIIVAAAALLISSASFAQVGTAVKEGAKATGDKVQQGTESAAGAMTKEPRKTVHKVKSKYHKAKAHEEATEAKQAVKNIGK